MSYRNMPVPRQRSSSISRNGTSNNSLYSRPRSFSLYGSNVFSPYYSPSSLNSYYSSNYSSPYYTNGYRASNGYASLSIPTKVVVPNYSKTYDKDTSARQSRATSRTGSFNRDRSSSRSQNSTGSGMGSKSLSLTSLNSEGYASGTDRSNRSSRLGSTSDIRGENGEIDYKKLYEQTISENDRLKDKLRKSDEELRETKQTLERLNTVTSKNSLSELEKREKRAMERKLSEMEEELKQLQKLKAENERLRAENRALTRVVSKLTNSANK